MKLSTKIILFLIILFSINVVFYYVSGDYRFFLKKLKSGEEVVYIETPQISDTQPEIQIDVQERENDIPLLDEEVAFIEKPEITSGVTEIVLGKNYRDILSLFSEYGLDKIDLNINLFDLTDEYPDPYFEYYSSDVTLYFFQTKIYDEIYNIFELLAKDLPFTLNEVNNFGTRSFYINLNEDIQDNFIRLVIENKGIVFGLKIKKNEYNNIKEKLLGM